MRSQKAIVAGSPPCSPQIPSLRSGAAAPAALAGDLDQRADPGHVQGREGIGLEDPALQIVLHEPRRIVARQAERHLGQIIGAEAEELREPGDLLGAKGRPRHLDHGADLIGDLSAGLGHDLLGDRIDPGLDQLQLTRRGDQRHHDLGHHRLAAGLRHLDRRAEDRARLHLVDLGEQHAQATAAQAEHRIDLAQLARPPTHGAPPRRRWRAPPPRPPPARRAGTRAAAGRAAGS